MKYIRRLIHKMIVAYLLKSGKTFHHGKYEDGGQYVVLMDEYQYNLFTNYVDNGY